VVLLNLAYAETAQALWFSGFICVGILRSRRYRNCVTGKKSVGFYKWMGVV